MHPEWSDHKWTALTAFRVGPGCMWPHSFSSVYRRVSRATLKDRPLNWRPLKQQNTGRMDYTPSDFHVVHCKSRLCSLNMPMLADVLWTHYPFQLTIEPVTAKIPDSVNKSYYLRVFASGGNLTNFLMAKLSKFQNDSSLCVNSALNAKHSVVSLPVKSVGLSHDRCFLGGFFGQRVPCLVLCPLNLFPHLQKIYSAKQLFIADNYVKFDKYSKP